MASRKEYFYFIDTHTAGEKLAIVEKGSVTRNGWSSDYKTVQLSGTNNIKIRGTWLEDDLVAGTLTGSYTNIPARFHEYIVNRVIANGYKDPRHMDFDVAQYFDNQYEKGVKKAKKFARSNYQTVGAIKAQDF